MDNIGIFEKSKILKKVIREAFKKIEKTFGNEKMKKVIGKAFEILKKTFGNEK